MHNVPVTLQRGRVVGEITIPPDLNRVRAGLPTWPIYGESYPPPNPRRFIQYVMDYDDLAELGYFAGDTILVDPSNLGKWNLSRFDSYIILIASHFGDLMGRFQYDPLDGAHLIRFLDGKGTTVLWTPEMEVLGIAHFGWKDLNYDDPSKPVFR